MKSIFVPRGCTPSETRRGPAGTRAEIFFAPETEHIRRPEAYPSASRDGEMSMIGGCGARGARNSNVALVSRGFSVEGEKEFRQTKN